MAIDLKQIETYFKEGFEDYIINIEYIENDFFTLIVEGLKTDHYKYFDLFLAISKFGTYELKVGFGIIEKNLRNYELINQFNDRTSFKAYIDDESFMPMLYIVINDIDLTNEDEVLRLFNFHFESILASDEIHKYLLPITNNTIRPD